MLDHNQFNLFENVLELKQFDLPDANVSLYNNVFNVEESHTLFTSLLKTIKWQQDTIKFYGKEFNVPRLTAFYGEANKVYSYSSITLQSQSWTSDLIFIKKRIEAITETKFNSCLLNLYRTGQDSNDWHQDNEKELGQNPIIASVSFGQTRPFKLKHLVDTSLQTITIPLVSGSLLLMKGATQHFWRHKIPKTTREINPRINLTFRVINSL